MEAKLQDAPTACQESGAARLSRWLPYLIFRLAFARPGAAAVGLPCCSAASVLRQLSYGAVCRVRWRLPGIGRYVAHRQVMDLFFFFLFTS